MYYTLIWRNDYKEESEICWMGETFTNYDEAVANGAQEFNTIHEDMPGLCFTVIPHRKMWVELNIESKGEA